MHPSLFTLLCLISIPSLLAEDPNALAKKRNITCPRVAAPPKIDGQLDDPCWKDASSSTNFLLRLRLAETAKAQTTFFVCHDDQFLYFAARCEGQDPEKLFTDATTRDARRAYKDDVVEILMDPRSTGNDSFHLIINSRGIVWDAEEHRLPETEIIQSFPERWDSRCQAAGGKDGAVWTVELAVPFVSLGIQEAPEPGARWGFQVGREKWGADRTEKSPDTELSVWSRGYGLFTEPRDFGSITFGGQPAVSARIPFWKETAGGDVLPDETKGRRRSFDFTRVFVFGPPEPTEKPRPRMPANLVTVTPTDTWTADRGWGFESAVAEPVTADIERGYFGKPYSPLVRSFIGSRKPARFQFDVPAGDYVLHVISGAPFPSFPRPSDMTIRCGDAELRLESLLSDKMLVRGDLRLRVPDGKIQLDITTRTTWLLSTLLLYPTNEATRARLALDDLRREFYRFPLEEHYRNRLWLRVPSSVPTSVSEAERQAGFALFSVPVSQPIWRWQAPGEEDSRSEPLRALAGQTETVSVSFALHAIRDLENVALEVAPPRPTIEASPWMACQSEVALGRGSLNQWADVTRVLSPAESVHVEAGTTQQFYVHLRATEKTPPGIHAGRVTVKQGTQNLGSLPLRLGVVPVEIPEDPAFADGGYYNPFIFDYQGGRLPWADLTPAEQELALRTERVILRDLRSHGLNTMHLMAPRGLCRELPDGTVRFEPGDVFPLCMGLLREAGFGQRPIVLSLQLDYDVGGQALTAEIRRAGVKVEQRPDRYRLEGKLSKPFLDGITSVVRQIEAERKNQGWPEFVYDLWDEPGVPGMAVIRQMLEAVRAGGGRTYLTIVPQMASPMSDILDIRLYNQAPGVPGGQAETPQEVLQWKQKTQAQWWDYSGGCTSPDRSARFQVAYYWWAWNFDGICPWKVIKWIGDWRNDYDGWDVHPIVPTPSGIITSTIGWEMAREGKQDRNLLRHLERLCSRSSLAAAGEAVEFLAKLRREAAYPRGAMVWSDPISGAPIVNAKAWSGERFDLNRARLVEFLLRLSPQAPETDALLTEARAIITAAQRRESIRSARSSVSKEPRRQGNLVQNGAFEMDVPADGKVPHWPRWSPNGSIVTEKPHSGQRCFRFHHDKVQPNDCIRAEPIPLVPGRTYRFSAWAKRDAPVGKTSQFTGLWPHTYPDSSDKFVRRLTLWFPQDKPTFDWQEYELTFQATPTERFIEIWLYVTDEAGDIWMDDVALVELEE